MHRIHRTIGAVMAAGALAAVVAAPASAVPPSTCSRSIPSSGATHFGGDCLNGGLPVSDAVLDWNEDLAAGTVEPQVDRRHLPRAPSNNVETQVRLDYYNVALPGPHADADRRQPVRPHQDRDRRPEPEPVQRQRGRAAVQQHHDAPRARGAARQPERNAGGRRRRRARLPVRPDAPERRAPARGALRFSTLGAVFERIDHMGVAVEDLDAAIALHEGVYGMPVVHRETVTEQGVEAVLLDVGENHVELLRPLGPDTPVGRFLARRGPGLHHVAYQVADIEAALERLRGQGVRLIDETPRIGIRGSRVAFLHPAGSGSVLTELVEPATFHGMTARRAAIGFQGGQVLSLRISEENLTELRSALAAGNGDGWREVEAADGAVVLDLSQVVYLRVESDEHRVGF